jgi:hypothetical protein
MSDFSQNSLPARDPKAFLGFMNAVTEPSFHVKRLDKVTEPALWGKVMSTAGSPGAVENMQELATPQTPVNWMNAMMDPQFYQAMLAILSDPGKQARWAEMPMDPASYQPVEKFASPEIYNRWETVAAQPTTLLTPNVASTAPVTPGWGSSFPFSMLPR